MVLTDNLLGYWKLDETSGSIAFDSVNSNDIVLSSGATMTLNQTGKINKSIIAVNGHGFLGVDKFAANVFTGSGLSFTSWTKTSADATNTLFSFEGGYDAAVNASGLVNFKIDGAAPNHASTTAVDDGEWHFIAVTANDIGSCDIYIDGGNSENTFGEDWFDIDDLAREQSIIGNWCVGGANGTFDEIGLWNRKLSQAEVTTLYNNGIGLAYPFTYTTNNVRSTSIDLNNGAITQAKLTSTETIGTSGALQYKMTANGTNFESVTNGTLHTFANAGSDLRWQASGTNSSISQLNITDYK